MTATKRSCMSLTASAGSQLRRLVATELAQQLERHVGPDGDRAGAVGDLDAVEQVLGAVVGRDVAEPDVLVEVGHPAGWHPQCTILAIGISSRSVAPASLSAGITVLIPRFSSRLSTA